MRFWYLLAIPAVLFAVDAITDPGAGWWLSAAASVGFTVSTVLAARTARKEHQR
ncbi:hypothetical protein Aab01nite_86010 [Paractinoplanes abujensis]|uniref:Uncharacterized protein n=1 Tax=Paractinoplanes abujensis TaxID=882441 RepID=A0A7W7CY23_9ACTN|nr:hypothetical protein [Actinoplanes abujensis]MBB4695403.1 hypothetical protein [Actinoplanes abujensis]GID25011.1 hypothetical protein Aab01nite_86010 [Actinoplanes abujensis]